MFKHALCMLGFHKWSENKGGVRVCMRTGCTAIDMYFGITGALRRLREKHTKEEIEEMAKSDTEISLLVRLPIFMSIATIGGLMAIGVWYLIKHFYGNVENPTGAVIRMGMMAVFSILIWLILLKTKKKRRNDEIQRK